MADRLQQYYDSDVFNSVGEDIGAKRESEVPIPIADLRLVVPYAMTQIVRSKGANGLEEEKAVQVYTDVIVENVTMKRHTTGIDPFTGTDYGNAEIPKDHQYDPESGLPIFHRYIAGTQELIEWPSQKVPPKEENNTMIEDTTDRRSLWRQALGTIRHPIASLKRKPSKEPDTSVETYVDHEKEMREAWEDASERRRQKPTSKDPQHAEAYDDIDTTRNIVEGVESMSYSLLVPPFPETLGEELRGGITDFKVEARKDKDDKDAPRPVKIKRRTEQGAVIAELAKTKQAAAPRMKTPMQLRWETEHAKKVEQRKKAPLVSTDELMKALGRHIQAQKAVKKGSGAAKPKVEEVD